jgi:hypothetical protein
MRESHVAKPGERLDVAALAGGNEAHEHGRGLAAFQVAVPPGNA